MNYWGDKSDDDNDIIGKGNKSDTDNDCFQLRKILDDDVRQNMAGYTDINPTECVVCQVHVESDFQYCQSCWSDRTRWLPSHSRKRRKDVAIANSTNSDEQTESPEINIHSSQHRQDQTRSNSNPELCMYCYNKPRDSGFVHGKLTHRIACYSCAKRAWRKRESCPLCNRKIEKFTKII